MFGFLFGRRHQCGCRPASKPCPPRPRRVACPIRIPYPVARPVPTPCVVRRPVLTPVVVPIVPTPVPVPVRQRVPVIQPVEIPVPIPRLVRPNPGCDPRRRRGVL